MPLPFLDRQDERQRLIRAFSVPQSTLCCLYGRRRCGKSRLVVEALPPDRAVYHLADEREPALQRADLAGSLSALSPGFDTALYPDWSALFDRWWRSAPDGAVLALDEFPHLVASTPELPSILQRFVDRPGPPARHLVVCGSSQRMMHGLVLDARAPLYGRAREILNIGPLPPAELRSAFSTASALDALDAFALWGGVPRYWELAVEYPDLWSAMQGLVLTKNGVLHREPERLLLDDIREIAQAASVLALVARGCHRVSEIAARMGRPATALGRPLGRLQDMGLVVRDIPFGATSRPGGKSLYRIKDPFILFWFRYVEPNLSLLETDRLAGVIDHVRRTYQSHVAQVWEALVRTEAPRLLEHRGPWREASRWWGCGLDGKPLEVDLLASSFDGRTLLVGEVKLGPCSSDLTERIARLPVARDYDDIVTVACSAADEPREGVVCAADIFPAR